MQGYNNELVKVLEGLKENRDTISAEISKQQEEKYKIEQQVAALNDKLAALNRMQIFLPCLVSIQEKVDVKNSYEKTIGETEAAYMKVFGRPLLLIDSRKFANLAASSQKRRCHTNEKERERDEIKHRLKLITASFI